jgi:type II secretory pathway component GspD/PulD (secretin)
MPGEQLATGTLEQVKTRISFTILPTIISDDKIHIQLSLEQSEFTAPRYNAVLATNRNTARTSLVVDNGETIVIGGVNSSREAIGNRGIPVLRSIPILKYAFGASKKSSSSRKVSFYVTPHILPLEEEVIRERIE